MSANILFISENTLKSRTGMSEGIDGKQLKPQIKLAQDMYVQGALGSTLYMRLQSGIEANNLSIAESTLLNNYVTDCAIWYTMSLLPFSLGYQFFSKGVLQKTAEESSTPSRSDLELISNNYKQTAEFYKMRMVAYLRENYLLFNEYFSPGSGFDVIFPETKAYTSPIYLGGAYAPDLNRAFNNASASSVPLTIYVTPAAGLNSFIVPELNNRIVLIAMRSGQVKGVTNASTANSLYLQINMTTITLPAGDVTDNGELFSFTYR